MLTSDLAIASFQRKGRIHRICPDRIQGDDAVRYARLAASMQAVYREGIGKPRRQLHRSVEAILAAVEDCETRRMRAFCKLLDDKADYESDAGGQAAALRLRVFARAAECHPLVTETSFLFEHDAASVKEAIAAAEGRPWPEVEADLYRDVMDQQPLAGFSGYPNGETLIDRYNVAQFQAALYRAESVTLTAREDFKGILRAVKLAQLLHTIQRTGADCYAIQLDGPASVLRQTRRYGVSMARFLAGILGCRAWNLQARLQTPWGTPAVLELSAAEQLGGERPPPADFDSTVEEKFARKFTGARNGWILVREGQILHAGQTVFLPDFLLRHEDGTEIGLEIVGFWTPEYLAKKRETLQRFREHPILLVVAEAHLPEGSALPEGVVSYKSAIKIPAVVEAAEALRRALTPPEQGPAIALRDYQKECLHRILAAYREGARRQLVCLPTGTGKTVVFSEFPRFFQMKRRMLVLAHRAELLDQARDKIRRAAPHLRVSIDQGARRADPEADVVVASVPTLGRENSRRLAELDPAQFFLIVVDEAHHATAATYKRVLDHFDVFAPDTPRLVVGFTATPKRGDGQGLNQVFERIVFSRSLPEMITAGYLAPVAGYRVETEVDLSATRSRMGDFVVSQLAEAVNVVERNALVIDVYRKHLAGRKTLCFCVDVAHARCLAAAFAEAGVASGAVYGSMSHEERLQVLDAFRRGDIAVLTNCMVLTEGYDEPSVEGIILARPTQSTLLYTQMIGRGTRLHPGKEDVAVVDIVDATRTHKLVTLPSLFGFSESFDMEGRTTREVQEAMDWVEKNRPWVDAEGAASLSDLRYRCTRIDLVGLAVPPEIESCSRFAWARVGHHRYRLGLANGAALTVSATILDTWELQERSAAGVRALQGADSLAEAIAWAEAHVEATCPDQINLVARRTRWRDQPASEKQVAFLRRKGIGVPETLTKGQASHLIGMLAAPDP